MTVLFISDEQLYVALVQIDNLKKEIKELSALIVQHISKIDVVTYDYNPKIFTSPGYVDFEMQMTVYGCKVDCIKQQMKLFKSTMKRKMCMIALNRIKLGLLSLDQSFKNLKNIFNVCCAATNAFIKDVKMLQLYKSKKREYFDSCHGYFGDDVDDISFEALMFYKFSETHTKPTFSKIKRIK